MTKRGPGQSFVAPPRDRVFHDLDRQRRPEIARLRQSHAEGDFMRALLLALLVSTPALADCGLDRRERAPAYGLPDEYHVTCDDGRTGTAEVDSAGDTRMTLYPSPLSHNVYPRTYQGRISGQNDNPMYPDGPDPNPRPRVQPQADLTPPPPAFAPPPVFPAPGDDDDDDGQH